MTNPSSTMDDSATSSKSCLVLPGLWRRNRGKISSARSTDQSSTAENIFNPRANNDQQQLLVQTSNVVAANWYDLDDDDSVDGPGPTTTTTPPKAPWAVVAPSSTTTTATATTTTASSSPVALLSFPTPKDRSHHTRRHQNQEQGIMHSYDGELEPEGVRGQEAIVVAAPRSGPPPELPLRSFSSAPPPSPAGAGAVLLRPLPGDHDYDSTTTTDMDTREEDHEWSSVLPPPESRPPNVRGGTGDNASTTSSQDLVDMMTSEFTVSAARRRDPPRRPTRTHRSHQRQPPQSSQPSQPQIQKLEPTAALPEQHRIVEDRPARSSMSSDVKSGRKSAPVSVDDSSFQDPIHHVQGIHAMAMEHVMRGEYDMALQAFSQVLAVYLEKYGAAHPMTASAYHNLGTVHSKRAGLMLDNTAHQRHCREQALLCFQAAARSARDAPQLGPSHPNVAVSLVRIGFLLLQSQQYQNAVITFREALRIRIEHYGATHTLVANLYNNLGVCHMHLQEFVVGRKYLQQALDIQKDLLGHDEYSVTALLELADTLCNIGGLCLEWIRQQGPDVRHALDGEAACLEALEVRAKVLGEDHVLTHQVRSLYDMVRSVPLPKVVNGTSSGGASTHAGPTTARMARHLAGKGPPPGVTEDAPTRPSLPPTPERSQRLDPPGLDHPDLRRAAAPSPPPSSSFDDHGSSYIPTHHTTASASTRVRGSEPNIEHAPSMMSWSDAELNAYEATEENVVLDHSEHEDGQMTVISYAQSTASISSSTQRETERLAYLMQAKAILDAHRESQVPGRADADAAADAATHVTTPERNSNSKQQQQQQSEAPEDGLAPLGGNWPEQRSDRITPEVLRDPAQHLRTIHAAAVHFFRRGRNIEALHLLEIVLDTQRKRNGLIHEDVGAALHNVGIIELKLGKHDKALEAFEEAVRVRKSSLGHDHPHVAVSLVKVGITLMLLKRFEDSLWIFKDALSVRQKSLGPTHPSTARIYNNIGCVHVEFGDAKEAKKAFEGALQIQRKALENDPESGPILFGAATTLQNLAYLYRQNELYEKEAIVLRESFGVSSYRPSVRECVLVKEHRCLTGFSFHRSTKKSWGSYILLSWERLKVSQGLADSLVTTTTGSNTTMNTWNVSTKCKTKIAKSRLASCMT